MCLFYNKQVNNAKGTICDLIRSLISFESVVSIPMSEFSDKHSLAKLPSATAIICDENRMGYIKDVSALKAVITGDPVKVRGIIRERFRLCI